MDGGGSETDAAGTGEPWCPRKYTRYAKFSATPPAVPVYSVGLRVRTETRGERRRPFIDFKTTVRVCVCV